MTETAGGLPAAGVVQSAHRAAYEFPIRLREGDRVRMIVPDDEYPDYWWCVSMETGAEGWVPQAVLDVQDDETALAREDYSAIELDVDEGQRVTVHAEGGGWLWCESESGDFGWVPVDCVVPADEE